MPDERDSVDGLLASYLARENAATVRHYPAALDDFAAQIITPDRLAAASRLLDAGFAAGNEFVAGYQQDMEGLGIPKGN